MSSHLVADGQGQVEATVGVARNEQIAEHGAVHPVLGNEALTGVLVVQSKGAKAYRKKIAEEVVARIDAEKGAVVVVGVLGVVAVGLHPGTLEKTSIVLLQGDSAGSQAQEQQG